MIWEDAVRSLIDDQEKTELTRQCYFDAPLAEAAKRFHESDEWASVRSQIQGRSGRALDVGAGNGIVSFALAEDGWDVTAVEPDSSALVGTAAIRALFAKSGRKVTVIDGVTGDIDTAAGDFDVILVRQVLHHAPELNSFADDLARLLRPGGLLLTWRDHVISSEADLPDFFDRHPLHHLYGGENAFTIMQYRAAFVQAGLTIVKQLRHFDDSMNYGPASPHELIGNQLARKLPKSIANAIGLAVGNRIVFSLIAPVLSAMDRRPGRHVAFLIRKPG